MQMIPSPQAYTQFINLLHQQLQLPLEEITQRVNPQLIAPYYLQLPLVILTQAQQLGVLLFKNLPADIEGFSACIDFHWVNSEQQLKIIECNTNAAFLGLSIPLYLSHQLTSPLQPKELVQQWQHYTQQDFSVNPQLTIIDELPEEQKLYVEFLYFQKIFDSLGAKTTICDVTELPDTSYAVYNRSTNFLFSDKSHLKVNQLWQQHPQRVSPNPNNYLSFADKKNLITWQNFAELGPYLPDTHLIDQTNESLIWSNRKKYFIKPQNSYGSKSTYRGESISRKLFTQLIQDKSMLAQEFVPAPELSNNEHGPLKFDLRFYYHKSKVTQAIARLYQGQVTNSRTPGGGFAPILWQDAK